MFGFKNKSKQIKRKGRGFSFFVLIQGISFLNQKKEMNNEGGKAGETKEEGDAGCLGGARQGPDEEGGSDGGCE